MQKITPDSLRELNAALDAAQVLSELGSRRVDVRGSQILADCPLEAGVKATLTVELGVNFATCGSKSCAAAQRRSLLWVYCKATGKGLQEGAQELAAQTGVLLEYEGEEPKEPEAPKVIEIVDAPPEIGPVESASMMGERKQTQGDGGKVLHCPILRQDCLQDGCQWWVVEWLEEKHTYRRNCAVSLIAIGIQEGGAPGKKK